MKVNVSIPDGVAYGADETLPTRVQGQSVAEVAYNTVYGFKHGIEVLAKRMNMSANTLAHKVNLKNKTHHLSLREAIDLQRATGNFALLHAMADELGHTATLATPAQAEGNPVETIMRMHCEFADFTRAVADAVGDGTRFVTGNEMRRADYHGQEAVASVGHTLSMLRSRVRKAPTT